MKKDEIDILNILKYGMVVILVIYVAVLLSMEGGGKTPVKTVHKAIMARTDTKGMTRGTTQDLKKYYGLNAKDYEGVILYIPDDVMSVNELLVVKVKDENQAQIVEKAAQKRLDTQLKSFEGYGAKQTKLIKSAVLEERGVYVLFVISKDADAMYGAFKKSL